MSDSIGVKMSQSYTSKSVNLEKINDNSESLGDSLAENVDGERAMSDSIGEKMARSDSPKSVNLENINYEPDFLDESSVEDVDGDDDSRIVFDLSVSLKNFQSQKNGTDSFVLSIRIESVDHFEEIVWNECYTKLKREVLYDPASTILDWSPCKPQWEDRNRFFVFQDKAMKKIFHMDDLTMELLQGWHCRKINMFCLVYSVSLKSLKDYNTVKSKLMTCKSKDRAGADSNQSLQQLVVELKEKTNLNFEHLKPAMCCGQTLFRINRRISNWT